jgi:hypothetical protein
VADIVDSENGLYVNRLTVVYHSIAYPNQPPSATVVLIVDAGTAVNRDELRREIEQMHYSIDDQGQRHHQPFVLEDRYNHYSWGADAASMLFVISAATAAVQGIVGGAAWDGLKSIGRRIRSAHGPATRTEPLNDQEAIRRAQQIAAAAFDDISPSGFTVLSVSVADNTATVVMRYRDGSTFTVQPSMLDGGGGAIGPIVRAYTEPGTDRNDA